MTSPKTAPLPMKIIKNCKKLYGHKLKNPAEDDEFGQ